MRNLIYKRTHNGDPDAAGCFGAYDCMGTVRDWSYDAVIGVGGIGIKAQWHGVDGMVNWIGIGPKKRYVRGKRGPEVTFAHFVYFGNDGPDFRELAPRLSNRMYKKHVRFLLGGLDSAELAEATKILRLADDAPPSSSRQLVKQPAKTSKRCSPRQTKRNCS